jgi:hypothetical protein
MRPVHVECKPDELLVGKLGIQSKQITHYQGKYRVFHALNKKKNEIAVVDEDPGSNKTTYEKSLQFIEESVGIKHYIDNSGNNIFVLKGKLEDWIIGICKIQKIKLSKYNLPEKPNDLHNEINNKLQNFGKLLDDLISIKNPGLLKLKSWLD